MKMSPYRGENSGLLHPFRDLRESRVLEFFHSVGMTESSPAIYRRARARKRLRPIGTLDLRGNARLQSSLRDGPRIRGEYPAINLRATFEYPSGTSVSHLAHFPENSFSNA